MSANLRFIQHSFLCAFYYVVDSLLVENVILYHMNYQPHVLQPNSWVLHKKKLNALLECLIQSASCLSIGSTLQVWSLQTAQEMVFITVASALTLEVSVDNESNCLFFRKPQQTVCSNPAFLFYWKAISLQLW